VITQIVQLAQLALACAGFVAIVFLVSRSAMAGATVVLMTFLLFEASPAPVGGNLVFQFGTISVYPGDVASLALLSVGTFRLITERIYGPAKIVLVTIVVFLFAHLVWGATEFGLQQATNSARIWFPIVSGIVFGATVQGWDRRLPTAFIATGCALAVLSIVGVFQHGLYSANTVIKEGDKLVDARPVISIGVLVMLEALILLFARGRFTLATASLAVLLASGIVLLQYRTLWVAAIACAVLGAFFLAARFRASNERVVYLLTAIGLVLAPMLLFAISQVSAYQQSAESTTGASSTLTWRIGAWKTLLERYDSPFELAFGTPSGADRKISVDGLVTDVSAHNLYVEALLSYGLIGLFALCMLGVLALGYRRESARQLEIAVPAVIILIVSLLLVSMTHTPSGPQGLLLGSLLSVACFQTQASSVRGRVAVRGRELAASR
jgi:hypothetical protein